MIPRKLVESMKDFTTQLEEKNVENSELEGLVNELKENITELQEANERLVADLNAKIQVAEKEITDVSASKSVNLHDTTPKVKIELSDVVDLKEWEEQYEKLRQLTVPAFENYMLIKQAFENQMLSCTPSVSFNQLKSLSSTTPHSAAVQTSDVNISSFKQAVSSEAESSLQTYQENISQLKNQIRLLESEIKDANNQIEVLKISNSIPESQKNDSKLFDLVEEMNKLRVLLEKSYENNRSLRSYLNSVFTTSKVPSLPNVENAKDLKFFSTDDIAATERSIQDCLALLRNMSKLIKSIEILPFSQGESDETKALKQNVYKSKKIMKVMHRNMLNMYRTIINSEKFDENLSCKNSNNDQVFSSEQSSKISDRPITAQSPASNSGQANQERGTKIKEIVEVYENRNSP